MTEPDRHRRRGLVVAAGALATALLAAGVWFAPPPYVVQRPGPVVDVLASAGGRDVIVVTGAETSASAGQLLLTTVEVKSDIDAGDAVQAWFDGENALVPREVVFPPGRTDNQVRQTNQVAFDESGTTAADLALGEMGRPAGVRVDINVADIGGPSAGLMITLGIVDKLTPADLTGGKVIAGTGVVSDDGAVGPIGGITQKLYGARAAGAGVFLVPAGNCAEAARVTVPGLTTARVASVDEALAALRSIAAGGQPPAC